MTNSVVVVRFLTVFYYSSLTVIQKKCVRHLQRLHISRYHDSDAGMGNPPNSIFEER